MGLLDQALGGILGGALGGRGGVAGRRSPIVNAVLMALAAKALQHYLSGRSQAAELNPGQMTRPDGQGGLSDVLGGVLGGGGGLGGLGGLLGSLGGAGALGGLLDQFNRRGLSDASQSWIGTGPNQPLAPKQLAEALDDDDVDDLAAAMGLPREQVLTEVAKALPEGINYLTPEGRLPTEEELSAQYADPARPGS